MIYHVEEWSGISFEMHEKNEVVISEILDEVVDVWPGNCHEFSLHSSFEDQFDNMQGNLQLGQLFHGKIMMSLYKGNLQSPSAQEIMMFLCFLA